MKVIIRPLVINDAEISYVWRNDPEVWRYTGAKPEKLITQEIEKAWLSDVLLRDNEKRFAICIGEYEEYIGNIQLTDIDERTGQYHIFIGNKNYWGKGIATIATGLILKYAFDVLKLKEVYLIVKKENLAAIKTYVKCGFKVVSEKR